MLAAAGIGLPLTGNRTAAPAQIENPIGPVQAALAGLTLEQQIGQLFMVGLNSDAPEAVAAQTSDAITYLYAGSVVLFGGGWSSSTLISSTVEPLQALAAQANGGAALFVSGNQEGGRWGSVQAFYGAGFSAIPSAVDQGEGDPALLQQQAQTWGTELLSAGVNLNLAPVLDTVPAGTEAANAPIGALGREYGSDPDTVTTYGVAFERGMHAAGVAVAIKHFPGLGRVTGNTDYTNQGIVDGQFSGIGDPYLEPYTAGINAGAEFVMISLATYPRVDTLPAVFSSTIINGILRSGLGFGNIVLSDDLGLAVAVADRSPADRALGFLRAGGDMVLTVVPSDIAPMASAVFDAVQADS
ncbi:MAG TPA: glycoside hydrolase family 3 N-terminal domain-containing protein, partial [Steroidobacteraceae bacterium]|nr:glycoside hydrolase family 3 N-terminal domain-containing protein [Steroidobacteraceae bacterium]